MEDVLSSWIMHLRVAERLLSFIPEGDESLFYTGCIAPDSGVPAKDGDTYTPPKQITHWQNDLHQSRMEDFYDRYAAGSQFPRRAFYLGYYVHLATDELWKKLVYYPDKARLEGEGCAPDQISAVLRGDWHHADAYFLNGRPDYAPFLALRRSTLSRTTGCPIFPTTRSFLKYGRS